MKPKFRITKKSPSSGVYRQGPLGILLNKKLLTHKISIDKIAIIRREIHSITDFVDILEGYCIFDDEFAEIFKSLGDMDLALLIKKLSTYLTDSNFLYTENGKEWHDRLNCFFKEIDLTRKESIRELSLLYNS